MDDAGQGNHDDAGNNGGSDDVGAAGEGSQQARPLAIFPRQLQVDAGCGASTEPTELVIRNDGLLPLTISSATATAGYVVTAQLPLQIAPTASATLQVTPPVPKASASLGDRSSGTLTFVTNETNGSTHEVRLDTTLFGGKLVFTDGSGSPLLGALSLSYESSDTCPDYTTYRVHNTGNLAFTMSGPTFPTHFRGSSSGANGQNVAPDAYIELKVGGNSSPDGACSGSGELTFTVQGPFCGAVPKLSVTWPAASMVSGCTCTAGTE